MNKAVRQEIKQVSSELLIKISRAYDRDAWRKNILKKILRQNLKIFVPFSIKYLHCYAAPTY